MHHSLPVHFFSCKSDGRTLRVSAVGAGLSALQLNKRGVALAYFL